MRVLLLPLGQKFLAASQVLRLAKGFDLELRPVPPKGMAGNAFDFGFGDLG